MTDLTQAEWRTLDLLRSGDRSGSRSENGNTVLGTVATRLVRRGLVTAERRNYTRGWYTLYRITDDGRAALRGRG